MKRLVIINFDDMFVNVSKIICNILNSLEEVKKRNILIREYQLGCDLEKPFLTLFYEMLEDYDISVDQETLSTLELDFKNNLIKNAVLADGLQNFLNEAKERNVEVRVITNKSYDEVVNCVKHFTFDLVTGVDSYKESPQAIKLIEKIQKERCLSFDEILVISSTDFGDEYLETYEYNKEYCGEKIFHNYDEILPLLYDEDVSYPSISVSLDINVKKEYYNEVFEVVKDVTKVSNIIKCNNDEDVILVLNTIEVDCYENDSDSMMIENVIDKSINNLYGKKDLLSKIKEQYNCQFVLSCTIYVEPSKVNPCVSLNKKIVKFLAENNIELDYAIYC